MPLIPEDFGAKGDAWTDDSQAFREMFRAAAEQRRPVYIPVPIKRYRWKSTVTVQPPPDQRQLSIRIDADPYPSGLIEFSGQGPAIRFFGLKGSEVRNLRIRSLSSNTAGFDISADTLRNSLSGNLFEGCRFDSAAGTTGNIGFLMGGLEGADVSQNIFERCAAVADLGPQTKDADYLHRASDAGHRGFVWTNSNNLDNLVRMGGGQGQRVVFDHSGFGGNGTRYDSCHPTFSVLGWQFPGGFSHSIAGGRSEHMRALVLHGDPLADGRGSGRLSFQDHLSGGLMGLDETFGLVDAGVVIALNNQARADLSGLTLYNPDPGAGAVRIRYNGKGTASPTIVS